MAGCGHKECAPLPVAGGSGCFVFSTRSRGRAVIGNIKAADFENHGRSGVNPARPAMTGRAGNFCRRTVEGQILLENLSADRAGKIVTGHGFFLDTRAQRPGSAGAVPLLENYFALTVMVRGLTSSALGSVMVRTPFSNSALALSATISVGRLTVRSKAP